MGRDRRGRFTAERTTTVTERITLEHHHDTDTLDAIPPLNWAHGWDRDQPGDLLYERHQHREQRQRQVWRAAEIVVAAADPSPEPKPLRPMERETLRQVVNILRAGPRASQLEAITGRSI